MWRKPALQTIKAQLDYRANIERDLRPYRIVQPGPGGGFYQAHDLHDATAVRIVSEGSIGRSLRPGEVVIAGAANVGRGGEVILSAAPTGMRGTAEFQFPALVGAETDGVNFVSADPPILYASAFELVTRFTGYGLRQNPVDLVRAWVYNTTTKTRDDDPLVTLGAVTWINSTTVDIPVSVSALAPAGYRINYEVVRA